MTIKGTVKGVRQRGKKYFIDYRADGKRVRKIVGTSKKTAELVLSKRKVEVVENRHLDVKKPQKITLEEFAQTYLELHSRVNNKLKAVSWDERRVRFLVGEFSGKCLDEITPIMIEKFKSERLQTVTVRDENGKTLRTLAPATVNRELACLKSMFNKAIQWGKATDNPVRKVKMLLENNKRLQYLEQDKIVKLIDNCSPHLKPIVVVAVFTGMRKGEILNLKWDDIDFTHGIIYLLETKNNSKREVPMNDIVSKALAAVKRTPGNPYVFISRMGKPYTEVRKSFSTALNKSDIVGFHFHDLRHTYASQLVMMGVDIMTVKDLLGHKSIEMTMRYSHLSSNHKRKAVDLLGNKMGTVWAQGQSEVNNPESLDNGNSLKII